MKRRFLTCLAFFLQLAASAGYGEITREMRFKMGALEVEMKYQDPSDVDVRLKDSRVLPFHFAITNSSNRFARFDQQAVKLNVGLAQPLAPVSLEVVLEEIGRTKRMPSLFKVLKIISAQSSAFHPNTLKQTLKRRSLQGGGFAPGEKRTGLVFFMMPAEQIAVHWSTLNVPDYSAQAIETKGVGVKTCATPESFLTRFSKHWKKYIADTAPPFNKSYALLLGVGKYQHLEALSSPAKDVDKMKNFLDRAGFDEIIFLTDDDVTISRLRDPRGYFHDKLEEADRFLFYYSGHAASVAAPGQTQGYLPLADAKPGQYDHALAINDLINWMGTLKAKHLLVILDCCLSEPAVRGIAAKIEDPDYELQVDAHALANLSTLPARYLLLAGTECQETMTEESRSSGRFTDTVIRGLEKEADLSQDQLITVKELYGWLRPTAIGAAREKRDWSPLLRDFEESGSSEGEFFFIKQQ